jgi:hypothetical protein
MLLVTLHIQRGENDMTVDDKSKEKVAQRRVETAPRPAFKMSDKAHKESKIVKQKPAKAKLRPTSPRQPR